MTEEIRKAKRRQQDSAKTFLSGKVKTMLLSIEYKSDILHSYLSSNQQTMLSAYERLGALLKMLSKEPQLLNEVNEWHKSNTLIASTQLETIELTREAIDKDFDGELPSFNIPESYNAKFEASHPVVHTMMATLRAIDSELSSIENLYLAGAVDDEQFSDIRKESMTVIRGLVDRIYKATSPGKDREKGRFSAKDLAEWLRQGNKLATVDAPQDMQKEINKKQKVVDKEEMPT